MTLCPTGFAHMAQVPVVHMLLVGSVLEVGYLCCSIIYADFMCEGHVCPIHGNIYYLQLNTQKARCQTEVIDMLVFLCDSSENFWHRKYPNIQKSSIEQSGTVQKDLTISVVVYMNQAFRLPRSKCGRSFEIVHRLQRRTPVFVSERDTWYVHCSL